MNPGNASLGSRTLVPRAGRVVSLSPPLGQGCIIALNFAWQGDDGVVVRLIGNSQQKVDIITVAVWASQDGTSKACTEWSGEIPRP